MSPPPHSFWPRLLFIKNAVVVFGLFSATVLAQEQAKSVRLTIDYGDGVQKIYLALACQEKMTVLSALQAAEKHPRPIRLAFKGSGETTFITAIDDVENEGFEARNWRYSINDQPAQYSAGVAELKPGDVVIWRFAK